MSGVILLILVTALAIDSRGAGWVARAKGPFLDMLVGIINPIGGGVTLLIVCIALGLVCRGLGPLRLGDAAWLGALAFASAGLVQFALKHLVGRPRPGAVLTSLTAPGVVVASQVDSFPSGHATSVFAVATVFAAFYPALRWPLYVLAAAVALGRVYLERHYVSDVVAGAVIGTVIAAALLRHPRVMPRWMNRQTAGII